MSFNFAMCDFFDGVNNNRSSIIASQYFLPCKQSNIGFIYDCQMRVRYLIPLAFFDINMMCCQGMVIFHNIFLNFLIVLVSEMHLSNVIPIVPHI